LLVVLSTAYLFISLLIGRHSLLLIFVSELAVSLGVFCCMVATVLARNVSSATDFRPYIIVENGRPKVLARHLEELTQGFRCIV